jgi:SPX domain protein involved in polyphosphate accumulation
MAIEVFNRQEIKYIINDEVFRIFTNVLNNNMEPDKYSAGGRLYHISNIYYDTPLHDIIRKSIDKPVYKVKLRLRSYGDTQSGDRVFLEMKKKFDGLVNKRRTAIYLEEAERYIETRVKPEIKPYMNRQVLNEIDFFIHSYEDLQPMVRLSYDRVAFFGREDKSFRVTFDTNIRSRRNDVRLESASYGRELLPQGLWVMEVKAERAIPLWFTRLLSDNRLYPTSFSKYGTDYRLSIIGESIHNEDFNYKFA